MSKIVVPELDVCHKFVNNVRRNISDKFFNFYEITHWVGDEEFTIFISYDPVLFDIDALIVYIVESAKNSDLVTYHWKVHKPLIHKRDNLKLKDNDFEKEVVISFQLYKNCPAFGFYTENTVKLFQEKTGL